MPPTATETQNSDQAQDIHEKLASFNRTDPHTNIGHRRDTAHDHDQRQALARISSRPNQSSGSFRPGNDQWQESHSDKRDTTSGNKNTDSYSRAWWNYLHHFRRDHRFCRKPSRQNLWSRRLLLHARQHTNGRLQQRQFSNHINRYLHSSRQRRFDDNHRAERCPLRTIQASLSPAKFQVQPS